VQAIDNIAIIKKLETQINDTLRKVALLPLKKPLDAVTTMVPVSNGTPQRSRAAVAPGVVPATKVTAAAQRSALLATAKKATLQVEAASKAAVQLLEDSHAKTARLTKEQDLATEKLQQQQEQSSTRPSKRSRHSHGGQSSNHPHSRDRDTSRRSRSRDRGTSRRSHSRDRGTSRRSRSRGRDASNQPEKPQTFSKAEVELAEMKGKESAHKDLLALNKQAGVLSVYQDGNINLTRVAQEQQQQPQQLSVYQDGNNN